MSELIQRDWVYEPLTNDAMFHLVFLNNEKARMGLVSALLNISESEIQEIRVMNPMQYSDAMDAKLTVLDLRLHLNNDSYLNIEMQVKRFQEWLNRTVVYTCRQVTEQSNAEGFNYSKLEPVIHVAILDHTLFEDHKRFFAKYELKDEEGYRYTDKIQFYVMDLKAIADADEQERKRGLVEWAEAFNAKDWEQIGRINNPGVKEAAKQMQTIMSTPEQRQMIWSRRMAQMDYDTQMDSARKEGWAEGLKKGQAEGLLKGRTEGRAEGTNKAMALMARLFSDGRTEDASRAASDEAYRNKLYAEFGMSEN